ncbi:hypothetical protein ACNFU2_15235 [Chryseobacterium sp. PTM-20240506]|uniref:hypothetical protein n=1 Tax=unclassified Chryseobacterium TaxID=2593645 RepID=UPI002358D50A|nr:MULTISPECIES: hypothetical protein [unclassified Chryseobacterium]MDC8106243.1 hypothetical protein [Chryseobacterium sp. B21-037]MDQ1804747.1 hypothetical protein [Chryseobacterium sp. CKR4-1]
MKNIFLGLAAFSLLTVSCKKDERATYIKEEASIQQPALAVNNTPKASILDQAGIKSNVQPVNSAPPVTAPGMNPPHGQPGHRCDIPVGQPLNSKPAQAQTTQNVVVNNNGSQTIQIDPNSLKPGKFTVDNKTGKAVKTAPGMNPPHGQPGHRCDIPVGQPLNSKPLPQPVQNAVQNTPVSAPEQSLATGEKPKLNPAHGEPFHNCSVKVGDPLP